MEGFSNWTNRYAIHLGNLTKKEQDEKRRGELEKLAIICKKISTEPAKTFYEALQAIIFIQIALCNEAYENAVSYGRLDQILYPYYKSDIGNDRITYEEAKELLALFCLKMDEVILVNDGDSFLNIAKLFETLSVDQALTFIIQGFIILSPFFCSALLCYGVACRSLKEGQGEINRENRWRSSTGYGA